MEPTTPQRVGLIAAGLVLAVFSSVALIVLLLVVLALAFGISSGIH